MFAPFFAGRRLMDAYDAPKLSHSGLAPRRKSCAGTYELVLESAGRKGFVFILRVLPLFNRNARDSVKDFGAYLLQGLAHGSNGEPSRIMSWESALIEA